MAELTDEQKKEQDKKEQDLKAKAAAAGDRVPSASDIAKAIKGLKFRTNKALPVLDDATGKPVIVQGEQKVRYMPDLRPMEADDVLKASFDGSDLVLVTKDGSKHRVAR